MGRGATFALYQASLRLASFSPRSCNRRASQRNPASGLTTFIGEMWNLFAAYPRSADLLVENPLPVESLDYHITHSSLVKEPPISRRHQTSTSGNGRTRRNGRAESLARVRCLSFKRQRTGAKNSHPDGRVLIRSPVSRQVTL